MSEKLYADKFQPKTPQDVAKAKVRMEALLGFMGMLGGAPSDWVFPLAFLTVETIKMETGKNLSELNQDAFEDYLKRLIKDP